MAKVNLDLGREDFGLVGNKNERNALLKFFRFKIAKMLVSNGIRDKKYLSVLCEKRFDDTVDVDINY